MSRQHAELRRTRPAATRSSTWAAAAARLRPGTRVSQEELNEGDIIALGRATFQLIGGELIEYVDDGADGELLAGMMTSPGSSGGFNRRGSSKSQGWVMLSWPEKSTWEPGSGTLYLRRRDAREERIDSLQAELRVLAAGNPALLDRLGIRPEPEV